MARPGVFGRSRAPEGLGEAVVTTHAAASEDVLGELRPQGPGDSSGEPVGPTPSTVHGAGGDDVDVERQGVRGRSLILDAVWSGTASAVPPGQAPCPRSGAMLALTGLRREARAPSVRAYRRGVAFRLVADLRRVTVSATTSSAASVAATAVSVGIGAVTPSGRNT